VPAGSVIGELAAWLRGQGTADYLTLSGSGEPTLNSQLGEVVAWLKEHADTPVAVLTNGSLLSDPAVRNDLQAVDLLVPSLDAGSPEVFQRLNRPDPSIRLGEVVDGLAAMRDELPGEMWLEVMLVKGLNDNRTELEAIRQAIDRVKPERVQINTVVRPPAESTAAPVGDPALEWAQELLGPRAEVIAPFRSRAAVSEEDEALAGNIIDLLRRRPCTLQDIADGLAAHPNWIVKHLEKLVADGLVRYELRRGQRYYWAGTA
jgi:wyosine [tRNA(Phe)-imidazoG37] synthetase (radical SAM superfamily)